MQISAGLAENDNSTISTFPSSRPSHGSFNAGRPRRRQSVDRGDGGAGRAMSGLGLEDGGRRRSSDGYSDGYGAPSDDQGGGGLFDDDYMQGGGGGGYGDNQSGYGAPPGGGYDDGRSGYGAPGGGYEDSRSGYGAPPAYGDNQSGYGAPPAYGAPPGGGYSDNQSGYGAPPAYGAPPGGGYNDNQSGYGAPGGGYNDPYAQEQSEEYDDYNYNDPYMNRRGSAGSGRSGSSGGPRRRATVDTSNSSGPRRRSSTASHQSAGSNPHRHSANMGGSSPGQDNPGWFENGGGGNDGGGGGGGNDAGVQNIFGTVNDPLSAGLAVVDDDPGSLPYGLKGRKAPADDDGTVMTMATKAQAFRTSSISKAKDMTAPSGEVTVIYTDVQGSTALWEACPSDMKKAQDIHDDIMRKCYTNHSGYEITTEGDAFNLAFQHPVDALAFALQAQLKLYKADWPAGILKQPDGKHEPGLKFKGFRVRFGMHHGPVTSRIHESTGRTVYSGEAVKVSKCVEGLCHGGQILTTMETWKVVSGMAERCLGRPQILDCGEHLLYETKDASGAKVRHSRRIMQLVPSELAFDFFEARGRRDVEADDGSKTYELKDSKAIAGRLFAPLISKRQLTTCFLNAPYENGKVTITFVYTIGLEDNPDTKPRNLIRMSKYVRKQLLRLSPPGYECQEDAGCWMLAFHRMANAVKFGLALKAGLRDVRGLDGECDRDAMFKVGILSGPFTSMGPHKTTGMADYFGPIVNRAARVASNCKPGQVCVGIPLADGVTADPPDFGKEVKVKMEEVKKLKGISIDFAIFSCTKNTSVEAPYR